MKTWTKKFVSLLLATVILAGIASPEISYAASSPIKKVTIKEVASGKKIGSTIEPPLYIGKDYRITVTLAKSSKKKTIKFTYPFTVKYGKKRAVKLTVGGKTSTICKIKANPSPKTLQANVDLKSAHIKTGNKWKKIKLKTSEGVNTIKAFTLKKIPKNTQIRIDLNVHTLHRSSTPSRRK